MYSRMKDATLKGLVLAATLVVSAAAEGQGSSTSIASSTTSTRKAPPNERTQGLMFGVHTVAAQGVSLSGEYFDDPYDMNSGFGAGVMVGYGFNKTFSSYVSFDVAKQHTAQEEAIEGTFGLGHLEFGVRANLPLGLSPKTVPYVLGSMGRRALAARVTDYESGESADAAFHGNMFGLGAGLEHFISPNMSIDGGLHLSFGRFDKLTFDGEEESIGSNGTTNARLRVGITWRPRM